MPPQRDDVHNDIPGSVYGNVTQIGTLRYEYSDPKAEPPRLPSPLTVFAGRTTELEELCESIANALGGMVLVSGLGGTGTSALALMSGHKSSESFPDGALFIDLRGFRKDRFTSIPDVQVQALVKCGWKSDEIPPGDAGRKAAYERQFANKRMLIVLDHLQHESEALELDPRAAGCAVVATSHRMDGFVANQQFQQVLPLGENESRELLVKLLNRGRVDAEPEPVEELIELCGGLPKALCMAVNPIQRHPRMKIAPIAAGIRAQRQGTTQKDAIIDYVAAHAYASLSDRAAKLYHILGWHSGNDVTRAAMSAVEAELPEDVLTELLDHHLIEMREDDRYALHPLVCAHAKRQSMVHEGEDFGREAVRLWANWYLAQAQRADRLLTPDRLRLAEELTVAFGVFDDKIAAAGWLLAERDNLIAVQRVCATHGVAWHVWALGEALWVLFMNAPYLDDWLDSAILTRDAASACDDVAALARSHTMLSRVYMELEDYSNAATEVTTAIALASEHDYLAVQASAIEFEGRLLSRQGEHRDALQRYLRARELFSRYEDHPRWAALQIHFIGQAHFALGDPVEAVAQLREAEAIMVSTGHERDAAKIRTDLGRALRELGELETATTLLREAVEVLRREQARRYEANALRHLALISLESDDQSTRDDCLNRLRDLHKLVPAPYLAEILAEVGAE